jgi:hypothetical protein
LDTGEPYISFFPPPVSQTPILSLKPPNQTNPAPLAPPPRHDPIQLPQERRETFQGDELKHSIAFFQQLDLPPPSRAELSYPRTHGFFTASEEIKKKRERRGEIAQQNQGGGGGGWA